MKKALCYILVFSFSIFATACGGDLSNSSMVSFDIYDESSEIINNATSETTSEGSSEVSSVENEDTLEDEASSKEDRHNESRREDNNTSIRKPIKGTNKNNSSHKETGKGHKEDITSESNKDYIEEDEIEEDETSSENPVHTSKYETVYSSDNVTTEVPLQNTTSDRTSTRPTYTSYPSSMVSQIRYPTKKRDIIIRKLNRNYFKTVGRCYSNPAVMGFELGWSCASVEFDLECINEIELTFSSTGGSVPVFIEIYVDGNLIEPRTRITGTSFVKTIATDLPYGIHRVKIVRQSDAECPLLTFTKIRTYGQLVEQAPENSNLYIECIGDASLIGWGVLLEDDFFKDYTNTSEQRSIARNKEYQDATLAYPYLAAQKLGADTYTLAKQGVGIAATWHKTTTTIGSVGNPRGGMLPTMYEYATPNGSVKYTETRVPDAIVLDAGSADVNASCLSIVYDNEKVGISPERAEDISKEFLKSLKEKYPNTKIIWCHGLTGGSDKLTQYVEKIVTDLGGEANGYYIVKLPSTERSGYPSVKEHAAAADILASKIKQILQ